MLKQKERSIGSFRKQKMVKPLKSIRNLREAKKAIRKAYGKEQDDLYQNLGTREGEKETYR